jgi:hypothetical protein
MDLSSEGEMRGLGYLLGPRIKKMVEPIYRTHGVFYADLFLRWESLVGQEYAQQCRPLKVSGKKPDMVLQIAASPSAASQLVYVVPLLLERIHRYFGFPFLKSIKWVNDLPTKKLCQKPLSSKASTQEDPTLEPISVPSLGYAPLQEALERWSKFF